MMSTAAYRIAVMLLGELFGKGQPESPKAEISHADDPVQPEQRVLDCVHSSFLADPSANDVVRIVTLPRTAGGFS